MAWSDFEDSVAKKAKKLKEGVDPSIDNAQTATINALNRLSGNPPPPPGGSASTPDTAQDRAASDVNLDKVHQMLAQKYGNQPQNGMADGGEVMSDGKPRFNHLKDMFKKHKKAQSELIASKDPMKFIRDNKSMSIKNKKGVAV